MPVLSGETGSRAPRPYAATSGHVRRAEVDGLRQDRQGPGTGWTLSRTCFFVHLATGQRRAAWAQTGPETGDRRPETLEGPGHDGMAWALVGSSGLWALGSGLWALGSGLDAAFDAAFERP